MDGHGRLSKREMRLQERAETLAKEMEAAGGAKAGDPREVPTKDEEIAAVDKVTRQLELDIKGKEKDMESRLFELNYLDGEKKRLDATGRDLRKEIEALSDRISRNESGDQKTFWLRRSRSGPLCAGSRKRAGSLKPAGTS